MRVRTIAFLLLLVSTAAVVAQRSDFRTQQRMVPATDQLRFFAREAKEQGQKKIRIPGLITSYLGDAGGITFAEAAVDCTIVIARLVSQRTYDHDGNNLTTWNEFAIDEVISEAKRLPCPGCEPDTPPNRLLPIESGHFLLATHGGKRMIEGVEVEQLSGFSKLELTRKYLMLINLYPSGSVHTLGGPVGVFTITERGDKAFPLRESEHRVIKDFAQVYGNSLDELRKQLKKQ